MFELTFVYKSFLFYVHVLNFVYGRDVEKCAAKYDLQFNPAEFWG